jgi:hypothetical protein
MSAVVVESLPLLQEETFSAEEELRYAEATAAYQLAFDISSKQQPGNFGEAHKALGDYEDVLAASLNTAHATETLSIWTAITAAPKSANWAGNDLHSTALMNTAFSVMHRPEVMSTLIDMYAQDDGGPVAQQIANIMLVRADKEYFPFVGDPQFGDFMAVALPDVVASRIEAEKADRAARNQPVEPQELDFFEKYRLEDVSIAVTKLVGWGSPDNATAVFDSLQQQWHTEGSKAAVDHLFDKMANHITASNRLLAYWGLDADHLEKAWENGYGQAKLPDGKPNPAAMKKTKYLPENLKAIRELEYIESGAAKGVLRAHHIRNFARYDPAMLAHMYQNRFVRHANNVVYATALHDDNGAFYKNGIFSKEKYDELITAGIGVHFVEFEHEHELAELANGWLRHRPEDKFQLIVPSGHGSEYFVNASGDKTVVLRVISTLAIKGQLGPLVEALTTEDATNVMNSCNTGIKPDGVAGTLRDTSDRRTLAPIEATAIHSLIIDHADGSINNVRVNYVAFDAINNAWHPRPSDTEEFNRVQQ